MPSVNSPSVWPRPGRPGRVGPIPLFVALVAVWLVLPQLLFAQGRISQRVTWLSLEFLIRGDTAKGVRLFATNTIAGRHGPVSTVDEADFDPPVILQWTQVLLPLIDSIDRLVRIQGAGVVGPALPILGSRGDLEIGYDPSLPYGDDFFLVWDDSVEHRAWRAAAATERIQALLDELSFVAHRSALRPAASPRDTSVKISKPPSLRARPMIQYPVAERAAGREGRVWVDFEVDTLGKADVGSVDVLFSDGEDFTAEVMRLLAEMSFRPAQSGNRPVRCSVRMPFVFTMRH